MIKMVNLKRYQTNSGRVARKQETEKKVENLGLNVQRQNLLKVKEFRDGKFRKGRGTV